MKSLPSFDLEGLVHRVYDAADDPRGFHDALSEIAHRVGADKAHLMALGDGQLLDNHFFGGDASAFAEYEVCRAQDPRIAAAATRPGQVLSDVNVIEPAVFERSAIYNEQLSGVGVRYDVLALGRGTGPPRRSCLHASSACGAALAEGRSLAEFADARGCSKQTARTHLKRILDKTGARRQADLVRVLLSGAALHYMR